MINDDVLDQIVYLEGSMAAEWNTFVPSTHLQIPTDLSKYIEFQVDTSMSSVHLQVDPLGAFANLRDTVDSYQIVRNMSDGLVSPALPVATDEWTTYFVQHLDPTSSRFDKIYILESNRNSNEAMETIILPDTYRYLSNKVIFHCNVFLKGS